MEQNIKNNDLITLTEAAEILGYKCFRQVNSLVKKGRLKAYKLALYKQKKFVSRKEVNSLLEVEEVEYGS